MRGLKLDQFAQERIERLIGNLWLRLRVIQMIVMLDLAAKLFHPLGGFLQGHASIVSRNAHVLNRPPTTMQANDF
jgi:hypothetical protein